MSDDWGGWRTTSQHRQQIHAVLAEDNPSNATLEIVQITTSIVKYVKAA